MRIREIKALLLKKGWAGRTISREETVARLNPLLKAHVSLNRLYARATDLQDGGEALLKLRALQKQARTDMGKLAETVFSCGGVAYTGIDDAAPESETKDYWTRLLAAERALNDSLRSEHLIEHQMRTEAVLQRCISSSNERLSFLNKRARQLRTAY